MRKLKKWSCLLLALLMLPALAACGKKQQPDSDASQNEVQDTDTPQDSTPTEEQTKVLVVYFSATGSTKAVAGYIADTLGADTFELTPQEPYLAADLDYNNSESRVCQEHADPALQDVALTSTAVESWERYDTVFVGYPIWWGIAAWPTDSFVEANDFTGKTVIPFCTSSSSGLGQSGELLAELAGTGDWLEGQRFRSGVSQEDVSEWVDGLGLSAQ